MANDAADTVVAPPSPLLALTELPRALLEFGMLPWAAPALASVPHGDGHPVLVIPGFNASDKSTRILRFYLRRLGYDVHGWDLGRNRGPRSIGSEGEKLIARLEAIHAAEGRRVSVVGWSLGGIMARVIAHRRPAMVRQVITLGAPFSGTPRSTRVWRIYEYLSGHKIDDPVALGYMGEAAQHLTVPSTAIWSRDDGIVPWANCVEPHCATTDNIEIFGSHFGMPVNPAVLYAVADRLAQPEDDWKPFDRRGLLRAMAYPTVGHA
ncbi:alpha/beta hydrolase [Sphingomonas sp.]|jgi:pimeloyl-ACP methyl ester carboxylesterase|uniref:esterase/lipase family protein n=1 Tax=Sphingomonas sp. TaxID=28214 RepID=UPI00260EEBB8|nr:alpha/beta hydrolase [Sphingomonas sp.]MDF2603863.1 alpha/beta fold hydrolase [Sphingomonas sp.]